jgi:hypothetical protein
MPRRMQWFLRSTTLMLLAMACHGCIAAIPMLISYYSTPSEYIATAEVPASADKVYATVVRDTEGAGPGMKIVKRDDGARLIEINDGVQTAMIKVIEERGRETQIIVSASRVEREQQKELALQVLLHVCKAYGEECSIRGT